jgi:methyl-accepting chemotaxis protein
MSVGKLLGMLLGAMGLLLLTTGALDLVRAVGQQAQSQRIVTLAEASRTLMRTLLASRLERGALIQALAAEGPADAATLKVVADTRRDSETGAAAVLDLLQGVDLADIGKAVARLRDVRTEMNALRPRMDTAIGQPKSARDTSVVSETNRLPQLYLDVLTATTDAIDTGAQLIDPKVDQLLRLKRAAWEARLAVGIASLRVNTAVASGKGWSPADTLAAAEDRARMEYSWTVMTDLVHAKDVPQSVLDMFAKAEAANFSPSASAARKQIDDALAAGKPAPITMNELRQRNTSSQNLIVELAYVALDELVGRANDVAHEGSVGVVKALGLLGLSLLLSAAGLVIVRRRVSGPIRRLTGTMRDLASGDLTVTVPDATRRDEIGAMAAAVAVFKDSMARNRDLEAEAANAHARSEAERRQTMTRLADRLDAAVGSVVQSVSSAAMEMQSTASRLTTSAEATTDRATAVSAAAEQAGANVAAIAGAIEELSASVAHIGQRVGNSAKLARAAVGEAEATASIVRELSDAAARIGDIVSLISGIASQTNLLALNATIEAARAGEAGRGFAVVAAEVKQLADQTAKATAEIGEQIAAIQSTTNRAVEAIGAITGTITTISSSTTEISSAVEQQGSATKEIAHAVQQASQGTAEVTGNIIAVAGAAEDVGSGAGRVLTASSDLASQSDQLKLEVQNFLATVRAA